jgi:hypothetical protein
MASTAVHFASFNSRRRTRTRTEDGHTTDEDTINDEGEGGKLNQNPQAI